MMACKIGNMKQEMQSDDEQVSALADGQLRGEEFAHTVEWVARDKEARLNWHAYHLVGDVLRSGEAMVGARELAFAERLKLRLQQEQPLTPALDTVDSKIAQPFATRSGSLDLSGGRVANDAIFRWKLLAALASIVAVGFISWQFVGAQHGAGQLALVQLQKGASVIVSQQAVTLDAGEPQIMVRDPQLDALLAAHRQSGAGSALAMSAGFLRNAAFEGAGR